MPGRDKRWHEVLECAAKMDVAVWIRAPDGKVRHVNHRAEALLGQSAADLLGRPCHRALAARDAKGKPFCAPECPVVRRVRSRAGIAPVDLRVSRADGSESWLRVLVLPFAATGHRVPYLVHCALCIDAERRVLDFVQHLAARSHHAAAAEDGVGRDPSLQIIDPRAHGLTARERQVLDLLAEDRGLRETAGLLGVTYATVRNHIQHILSKLGVHSILEAVAVHVLANRDPREVRPRDISGCRRRVDERPVLRGDPSESRTPGRPR